MRTTFDGIAYDRIEALLIDSNYPIETYGRQASCPRCRQAVLAVDEPAGLWVWNHDHLQRKVAAACYALAGLAPPRFGPVASGHDATCGVRARP